MTVQPLAVNRPVSIDSINRALAGDRMLLLVMQKNENDDPGPEDLRTIGTVGIIRQMAKSPVGLNVLVEGLARVRIEEYIRDGTMLRARIVPHPEPQEHDIEIDAYLRRIHEQV